MNKRSAILVLLVLSVGVMIIKAGTTYQNLTSAAKWSQAFGYGFSPWLLGLILASISEGWARIRGRAHDFTRALLRGTGVFAVLMVAATISAGAGEQKRASIRNDAMLLMGAGLWVPGIAAYCDKYVEPSQELLEAAAAWNKRHEPELEQTIRAIEWAGGLSKKERELTDRMAFSLLKQEVDAQADKVTFCKNVAQIIEQGSFDLQVREDTAIPLRRIMQLQIR